MSKALVVLSGGQDSTTVLFVAKQRHEEVHAITFDYGQRHILEIEAARKVAEMADVHSHEIIKLGPILGGCSPLTNPESQLELYDNHEQMAGVIGDRVELTFVPMRNALFLTIAANRAICLGAAFIYTGVCQEDNANYPDCRKVFIESVEDCISKALGHDKEFPRKVSIETPLMHLSKAETVSLAYSIPGCWEALAYSHTAYDGLYPPVGKDHASTLRAYGFEQAGLADPLVVRAWQEGLMQLPSTKNYAELREIAKLRKAMVDIWEADILKGAAI